MEVRTSSCGSLLRYVIVNADDATDHAEYYILATLGSEKKWSKPYAHSRDMIVDEKLNLYAPSCLFQY